MVISEARTNDKIYCIQSFESVPLGVPFSFNHGLERTFDIGEEVEYTGYRADKEFADKPGLGWLLTFLANDDIEYAAHPQYFVTEETWKSLGRFFDEDNAS